MKNQNELVGIKKTSTGDRVSRDEFAIIFPPSEISAESDLIYKRETIQPAMASLDLYHVEVTEERPGEPPRIYSGKFIESTPEIHIFWRGEKYKPDCLYLSDYFNDTCELDRVSYPQIELAHIAVLVVLAKNFR